MESLWQYSSIRTLDIWPPIFHTKNVIKICLLYIVRLGRVQFPPAPFLAGTQQLLTDSDSYSNGVSQTVRTKINRANTLRITDH
jgi:hypothetical protein